MDAGDQKVCPHCNQRQASEEYEGKCRTCQSGKQRADPGNEEVDLTSQAEGGVQLRVTTDLSPEDGEQFAALAKAWGLEARDTGNGYMVLDLKARVGVLKPESLAPSGSDSRHTTSMVLSDGSYSSTVDPEQQPVSWSDLCKAADGNKNQFRVLMEKALSHGIGWDGASKDDIERTLELCQNSASDQGGNE